MKSVEELVKNRLSFLPDDGSLDGLISDYKIEQYYFLQKWTKKTDTVVETDAEYTGLLRLLVVELTTYNLLVQKIIKNMGGENGADPTGGKKVKSGKADVVEAEFAFGKASDGNELLLESEKLIPEIKRNICQYSDTLGYNLPMCNKKKAVPPPFKAYNTDEE